MKRTITALTLLVLTACSPPLGDPSHEIIDTSKGVVGTLVKLKATPSLKSGSLVDAAQMWQSAGWVKVNSEVCKQIALPSGQASEAYEIKIDGYAPEKIPTRNLRLCASQVTNPKRIAAIGFVVSSEQVPPVKP